MTAYFCPKPIIFEEYNNGITKFTLAICKAMTQGREFLICRILAITPIASYICFPSTLCTSRHFPFMIYFNMSKFFGIKGFRC